jgi:hypothetical protein
VGRDQRSSGRDLSKEVVDSVDVPICEVRVIAQFARRLFVGALAEHHPEFVARQETPSLGINWLLCEAQNVHVVTRRDLQVTHCQHTPGINNLSHVLLSSFFA